MIINAFERCIFPLPEEPQREQWSEEIPEDMDDLESNEYAEQGTNQRGQGLKILTLSQMRSRLPISLVQIKTEITNSEKLKNEIRKLLYSLYHTKKWIKQSIMIWSLLFENGNNLYEQWK